ncbi:TAXI family TRAP transporter solute-binding subunit [Pseudomonas kuykendallii]|uniref:TAXI family TRAP transporter solute-binding subunit n=1 Tax=Pseudomonas kuykendallii TaxID=1007099 RepID=UPI0028D8571B|nr:TAXI family TRAP transporter solute-binding subunit [Pseudomonas kuykendallii]
MKSKLLLLAALLVVTGAASATPVPLRVCTGGEGGFYESLGQAIGKAITKHTGAELEVLNTGGSVENAALLKDGDCDIAVIQADAVTSLPLPADIKVSDAHTEVVYWLHGKGGVDDFGKMENDSVASKYAFAAVAGSGALVTVKNWIATDKDYEGARIVEFDDWYSAAEAVAQGYVSKAGVRIEIAGMLYIGRAGKITTDITEDFANQILIGEVNDSSFENAKDANNNPLYQHCTVAGEATSGLKTSTTLAPDTYCLRAQVVYNNDYHKGLPPKEQREVRRAVDKGINGVVKAVR